MSILNGLQNEIENTLKVRDSMMIKLHAIEKDIQSLDQKVEDLRTALNLIQELEVKYGTKEAVDPEPVKKSAPNNTVVLTKESIQATQKKARTPRGFGVEKSKTKSPTYSIYKGVTKDRRNGAWQAYSYIMNNGPRVHLGIFDNELDASLAYDRYVIKHRGPDCMLNHPELREQYLMEVK